jgi:hypothetical protein
MARNAVVSRSPSLEMSLEMSFSICLECASCLADAYQQSDIKGQRRIYDSDRGEQTREIGSHSCGQPIGTLDSCKPKCPLRG